MFRKKRPCRVVFDGQSRMAFPTWDAGTPLLLGQNWGQIVMSGRGVPAYMVAVGGTSLTDLAASFGTRAAPWVTRPSFGEPTIYVICGGFTDYFGGDSGAQVYADAWALGDLARGAGAQYVICTTTLPSTAFDSNMNAARLTGNGLILADASNKFDAQIDFEVDGLNNPADTGAYFDGVHIYGFLGDGAGKGTSRAAAIAEPFITAAIEAVT